MPCESIVENRRDEFDTSTTSVARRHERKRREERECERKEHNALEINYEAVGFISVEICATGRERLRVPVWQHGGRLRESRQADKLAFGQRDISGPVLDAALTTKRSVARIKASDMKHRYSP